MPSDVVITVPNAGKSVLSDSPATLAIIKTHIQKKVDEHNAIHNPPAPPPIVI